MAVKKRKPRRGAKAPAISAEPGLQPVIPADTKVRTKWAQVQLARDEHLLKTGYWFDTAAAERIIEYYHGFVCHSKGEWAGKPVQLEAWQQRVLRRLFGWKRPDGTRRYRKLHEKVPRKNGKSFKASGLALYLTCGDGEAGAEVYGAATDKGQAGLVFEEAKRMVDFSPRLQRVLQVYSKAIVMPSTLSSYKPLSKDSRNKDGLNIHGLIEDELHEWTDRSFLDKIETAQGTRREPLTAIFTTAGDDPLSIWGEEDLYAHRIADGDVEADEYLPVLYEAEVGDNWKDRDVWRRANPNFGISVKPDYLEQKFREALEKPSQVPVFKRYHLNLLTQSVATWMKMEKWDACAGPVSVKKLRGQGCNIGIDLSTRTDFTAAVAVFRVGKLYHVLPRFWIPEAKIEEKERRDKIPIRSWIERGLVEATPGDVIDYEYVRRCLNQWAKSYIIREIAFDPAGATQLALQLGDEDGIACVEFGQSILKMSEPTKGLEAAVLQTQIRHGGHPVLRWMAANARAYTDANGNVKLLKNRSAGRIDGVIALIMALSRAMVQTEFKSLYETQKPEVV